MLLEKSRAAYLKQLQALAEMREYLDFMSSTSECPSSVLVQMESVIVGSCYYCYIQEGGGEGALN